MNVRLIFITLLALVATPVAAAPATDTAVELSYQQARECYYALLNDAEAQQRRDRWASCIQKFLVVAKRHPKSQRAPDALFSAAKTYEQLFQASKNREDLRTAANRYRLFAKRYNTHRLADDALYRASVIAWEGFHDKAEAKQSLWQITKAHQQGDMVATAKGALAKLGKSSPPTTSIGTLLVPKPVPFVPALAEGRLPRSTSSGPRNDKATTRPHATKVIVIDPGHGGKDPGAHGPEGTLEKAVTLDISRRLAKALRQRLGAKVFLTRSNDRTLTLDDRNHVANKKRADLFISIHANAAVSAEQHGIQTYYLNNASDEASRRLATRENASAGKNLSDVQQIMSTMLQNAFTDESRRLSIAVHQSLLHRLKQGYADINDQHVRSALFYVLVGAKSPSILVETSYISNPREERRLRSTTYQRDIAAGIADGVVQFLNAKRANTTL